MVEYKYWGYIGAYNDGSWVEKPVDVYKSYEINPTALPDFCKIKLAMMDLMNDRSELPCGSYKVTYDDSTAYFIYIEVSSTRQGEK